MRKLCPSSNQTVNKLKQKSPSNNRRTRIEVFDAGVVKWFSNYFLQTVLAASVTGIQLHVAIPQFLIQTHKPHKKWEHRSVKNHTAWISFSPYIPFLQQLKKSMCGTDRSKRDYFCFGFVVHFLLCSLNLVFVWVFWLFWVFWLVGICFALIEENGEASESY